MYTVVTEIRILDIPKTWLVLYKEERDLRHTTTTVFSALDVAYWALFEVDSFQTFLYKKKFLGLRHFVMIIK